MKKIFTILAALACIWSLQAATETVYFVNALDWTGTIKAYGWGGTGKDNWPGNAMTKESEQLGGKDVYSYTKEAGTYPNIIFNNGSKQTADLKWTAGKYYVIDGWYSKEEVAEKLGQPAEDVYIIAGQTALLGSEWSIADPANKMTKQSDGSYKLVKENISLNGGKYEYKVAKNYSWDWCLPIEGNNSLTIPTTGVYDVTFTMNAALDKLDATAAKEGDDTVIEPTLPVVVLAGEMNEWSTTASAFVAAEDSLTASITIDLEAKDYQFKIVVDNNWMTYVTPITREQSMDMPFSILDGAENNAKITADIAGIYAFVWTYATNSLSIIYPKVPSAIENTAVNTAIKKIMCEGQVLILKDGKMYNMMGQEVK